MRLWSRLRISWRVLATEIHSYVKDYADRIAKGLRHDGYKNQLTGIDAMLIGSRYKVEVLGKATTIKNLSLYIAGQIVKTN